jgi:hypothetical protein
MEQDRQLRDFNTRSDSFEVQLDFFSFAVCLHPGTESICEKYNAESKPLSARTNIMSSAIRKIRISLLPS